MTGGYMRRFTLTVVGVSVVLLVSSCELLHDRQFQSDPWDPRCDAPPQEDNLTDGERDQLCGMGFGDGPFEDDPERRNDPHRFHAAEDLDVSVTSSGHRAVSVAADPQANFARAYQTFLEADRSRERCVQETNVQGTTCMVPEEQARYLLMALLTLVEQYPDKAKDLAPDIQRLRLARVAEFDAIFRVVHFDLTVHYGAKREQYLACQEDLLPATSERIMQRCGSWTEFCSIGPLDLLEYVALLKLVDAPGVRVKAAQQAAAWACEDAAPFQCDPEAQPDTDRMRAYALYTELGQGAAQRRVAKAIATELMGRVCSNGNADYVGPGDPIVGPSCDLAIVSQASEWLAKAHTKPDAVWFDTVRMWSRWAEERQEQEPSLVCDAIAFTKLSGPGSVRRTRQLTLAYGSRCP